MANRKVTKDVSDSVIAAAVLASFPLNKLDRIIEWASVTTLTVKGSNLIPLRIGDHWFLIDTATTVSTATDMDTGVISNGADYFVYACDNSGTLVFKISLASTYPSGFAAATSRKIGGFHTLCTAVGDIAGSFTARANSTAYALGDRRRPASANSRYYICITAGTTAASEPAAFTSDDTETGTTITDGTAKWKCEGHDLNNYAVNSILPQSVWDLKHRADNLVGNAGLTYDPRTAGWEGIYLGSDDGSGGIQSVNGATILDTIDWNDYGDVLAKVGMIMENDPEFASLALGSNEETNITGSADPVTTGGHSDTAGRRMISNIGCEDCAGAMHQWLKDQSFRADYIAGWGWYDLPGAKGSLYNEDGVNGRADIKLIVGGHWADAASCGSRCRIAYYSRWSTVADLGGRGRSRKL